MEYIKLLLLGCNRLHSEKSVIEILHTTKSSRCGSHKYKIIGTKNQKQKEYVGTTIVIRA